MALTRRKLVLRVAVAAALSVAGIGVGTNMAAGAGGGVGTNQDPEAATSFSGSASCDYAIPLANGMTHCVSLDGNIVSINVEGAEHIGGGGIFEGYEVCQSGTLLGYDSGGFMESGFTDVSSVLSGKTVTVVRNTGPIQLTQVITSVPGDHEVKVKMTLKNLSASPLSGVTVGRIVDADVDATFANDFLTTRRTVEAFLAFGADAGTLKLGNQSKAAAVSTSIGNTTTVGAEGFGSCTDNPNVGTVTGADRNMKIMWAVPKIQPSKTQTTTFTYTAN